jgi:aminopeptidase S
MALSEKSYPDVAFAYRCAAHTGTIRSGISLQMTSVSTFVRRLDAHRPNDLPSPISFEPVNRPMRCHSTFEVIVAMILIVTALVCAEHSWAQTTTKTEEFAPPSIDPAAPIPTESSWYRDILDIAAADDNRGRRDALRSRLQRAGFAVESALFKARYGKGENLLVPVAGARELPLLLIGAHSDRTRRGRGAADNASGCAVAVALAERLRERPLQHYRVAVAFWDMEELGLFGSKAYIAGGGERPLLYVNLDVLAWGDTLWMMTSDPTHPLVASSQRAAERHGLALRAEKRHPPSDHLAFYDADWPAVSYMLTDGSEIPSVLRVLAGEKPSFVPKLTATIHTHRDDVDKLDPTAIARGLNALEAALRDWDAQLDTRSTQR